MAERAPWSVKGIDFRAREAARRAAEEEGVTLGEFLNRLLLTDEDSAPPEAERGTSNLPAAGALDQLSRRIEAVEARSTLAITGIDQSVMGLVARIENAEHGAAEVGSQIDSVIDDVRATHDALHAKVVAIENDDTARKNLDALKALEHALGQLASHVYEENGLAQQEAEAIKGRLETGLADVSERVDGMETKVEKTLSDAAQRVERAVEKAELRSEGATRHLADRFSGFEADVAKKLTVVERVGGRMDELQNDVAGALESMEAMLLRVQDRLNRAESTTDQALSSLESTFAHLDERIDQLAKHATPDAAAELRRQVEAKFEGLAGELRASVAAARAEMAQEIESASRAANPIIADKLERSLDDVTRRLELAEARQARTAETMGDELEQVVCRFQERIEAVEGRNDAAASETVREEMAKLSETVEARLDRFEQAEADAFQQISGDMGRLAEKLDARVAESEQRSADAIEQVGEQVARVASRLHARQDEALKAMSAKLEETAERHETRLSDALASVSERLEHVQTQSAGAFSPVQKAIASLAQRVEAIEDFAGSPETGPSPADLVPEIAAPPAEPPLFETAAGSAAMAPVDETEAADLAPPALNPPAAETGAADPEIDAVLKRADPTPAEPLEPAVFESFDAAPAEARQTAPQPAGDAEPLLDFEEAEVASEDESAPSDEPALSDREAAIAEALAALTRKPDPFVEDIPEGRMAELETDAAPAPEEAAADDDVFEAGLDGWDPKSAASQIDVGAADVAADPFGDPLDLEWDDGRHETRDSDIFGDEPEPPAASELAAAFAEPPSDADGPASDAAEREIDPAEERAETDDYIARARRAAQAAADTAKQGKPKSKSTPAKKVAASAVDDAGETEETPPAKKKSGGRAPMVVAASAIVVAAAGATAYHQLRSYQPVRLAGPGAEPAEPPAGAPEPTPPPAEASDVAPAETLDEELFETTEADGPRLASLSIASDARPDNDAEARPALSETVAAPAPEEPTRPDLPEQAVPPPLSLEEAAERGDPAALYRVGEARLAKGDYAAGARLVTAAATSGEPAAQYRLAKLHEQGLGVPRDLSLARTWSERAAEGGNVKAMHDVAVYFAKGEGGDQSYSRAVEWFRRAAEFNVVDSQFNLALLYQDGLGVSADPTEALVWFEIAARMGDSAAPARAAALRETLEPEAASAAAARAAAWTPSSPDPRANAAPEGLAWNRTSPEQIALLQQTLTALGYDARPADGAMGEVTRAAIRAFEKDHGLDETGQLAAAVIEAVNTAAAAARS